MDSDISQRLFLLFESWALSFFSYSIDGEMSKISDEKIYGKTKEIEASKSEANDENGENDGKEEMKR